MPRFKRLFKSRKKAPPVPAKDTSLVPAAAPAPSLSPSEDSISTGDATACESEASTSSSRIIERTQVHATVTTLLVGNVKEGTVVEDEQQEPVPKHHVLDPRTILCCAMDPKEMQRGSAVKGSGDSTKRRIDSSSQMITTESIECVFNEETKHCVPSLMESVSISSSGSFSPSAEATSKSIMDGATEASDSKHKSYCNCSPGRLPPLDSKLWPQAPLLFRPQPNSGTKIIGIRKDASADYLWKPNDKTPWWHVLQEQWGSKATTGPELHPCCEYCAILPINNGNEAEGESLVADFETALFHGSLMLRLRHSEGTTPNPSDDTKGFFAGKPFRFQAIIRGSYQTDLPYTELVTGTHLERPCGKLPPKWVMWSALKVVSFFAPQLKTKLGISKPYTLSPLGSAPRTVSVEDEATGLLAAERIEPTTPERSLTGKAYPIDGHLERARARKRHFDQMYIAKRQEPRADPSKTYTMEFLQHLFDYQNFYIDLGSFQTKTSDILDGQPLQIMAKHGDKHLWHFEIWNESLLEDAKKYL